MGLKPIYEFLVWDNCNNNCKFCFQRKSPRIFQLSEQEKIIKSVQDFLFSENYQIGSNVLLVGGELFDDIRRFSFLDKFFQNIAKFHKDQHIDHLYINTNLIYSEECLDHVISLISSFKGTFERLHFTTSYDVCGRFKTSPDKERFFRNLNKIRSIYSNLPIFVNMILTNRLCNDILDGKEDLVAFQKEYQVNVNLIPYIVLTEELSSDRNLIFKTLSYIKDQDEVFFRNQMMEYNLKQQRKMFFYQNGWNSCECKCSPCGHSVNFKRYSNKNTCFVCDVNEIFGF